MNKKTTIIFDMDGVLVDSEPVILESAIRGLREYGVESSPEDFTPFIGTGEDRFIGGVAEKYNVSYKLEMKKRVYEIYLDIVKDKLKVYDGVQELILALKDEGWKLALASSADFIKVEANLIVADIPLTHFDAIVSGEDVIEKKPSPDIFLLAARKVNSHPSECIVVEDALNGVEAAKRAGMTSIALTTSFSSDQLKRIEPDFIFDDITCIKPELNNFGKRKDL